MKHYLLHFAAVYSIALVLLITVLVFGLNLGGLTLIPTLVACALISVGHFVKKEHRVPNNHEKIQLVWGSSAVAIIIGSFFVLFLVLMNPNAEAIMKSVDNAGIGHRCRYAMYGRDSWRYFSYCLWLVRRLLF